MRTLDFNFDWTVQCLTRPDTTKSVVLPYDAMLSEPRVPNSAGEGNTGYYLGGDYEYTKSFYAPFEWRDCELELEFESVYKDAEIYLNDTLLATHLYGYSTFAVPLNEHLHFGENNTLKVIAKNSDQPNSRWYSGTGIFRPVTLLIGKGAYIRRSGVKVSTVSILPPCVHVEASLSADATVKVEIVDPDTGTSLVTAEQASQDTIAAFDLALSGAELWSPKHPKLYIVRITTPDDSVEVTFGIRQLKWDAESGYTLNGERLLLRGACIHHDNGILGACSYPEAEARRVLILMENGYNAIRSAHNPASRALLDACDCLGMLVMDEYTDMWYIHKTKYDYALHMPDMWQEDLKALVDNDFNHPCVIMYSTGNEVAETAQPRGIELTGAMTNYLHALDPTRPVTCGINIFFNLLSSLGFGVYSDDKAEKSAAEAAAAAGTADTAGTTGTAAPAKKKHVGSDFYNTLATAVGDYAMKIGAALPPCDTKTKDAYANMDIAGYNYGIFRYKHDLKKYPRRLILGSETFCKDAYLFWEIARDHPRIVGDFVWAGWDYIGETGEGAAEFSPYINSAPQSRMTGGNGRIDLVGRPRAEASYTKVAFEEATGPFIAVMPPFETSYPKITGWQLTKAIESWSWQGCSGLKTRVEVFARAHRVVLFINGAKVGSAKIKGCKASFTVSYADGEITAVSYDKRGAEIGRQTLTTAGPDTKLGLFPEAPHVRPGGLVFVPIRYIDAEGALKPTEKHRVSVEVSGAELLGLGSACPYVEGNYTDASTTTYFGEALAVLRAPFDASAGDTLEIIAYDRSGSTAKAVIEIR